MSLLFTCVGWIGVSLVLIAYGLNSNGKIKADSKTYNILNMLGSCFIIADSAYRGTFSIVVFNIVWLLIAFKALIRKRS